MISDLNRYSGREQQADERHLESTVVINLDGIIICCTSVFPIRVAVGNYIYRAPYKRTMQHRIALGFLRSARRCGSVPSRRLCGAVAEVPKDVPGSGVISTVGAVSPRVTALLDDLVSLNMLEVKELTDGLKDRLGIDDSNAMPMGFNPAAFAAMGMGGPNGGAGAAAEEPKAAEQTHFDLKLEKFDAGKKIAVIKEVRAITGLGLKEAKTLVESVPKVFKSEVAKDEAEKIRDKLKELGGEVVLE